MSDPDEAANPPYNINNSSDLGSFSINDVVLGAGPPNPDGDAVWSGNIGGGITNPGFSEMGPANQILGNTYWPWLGGGSPYSGMMGAVWAGYSQFESFSSYTLQMYGVGGLDGASEYSPYGGGVAGTLSELSGWTGRGLAHHEDQPDTEWKINLGYSMAAAFLDGVLRGVVFVRRVPAFFGHTYPEDCFAHLLVYGNDSTDIGKTITFQ